METVLIRTESTLTNMCKKLHRGRGVKISTDVLIGERRGGLACKIAKWMMGVLTFEEKEIL